MNEMFVLFDPDGGRTTADCGLSRVGSDGLSLECKGFASFRKENGRWLPAPGEGAELARTIEYHYRRCGAGLAADLEGEFAFAVWDEPRGRLVAGCDLLGKTRLYHALTPAGAVVASTSLERIRRFLAASDIDEEYVADFLAQCWHTGSRTPFRAVSTLPPGEVLIVSRRGLEIRRLDEDKAPSASPLATPHDYAAALRDWLQQAVSSTMSQSLPTGCELSGGLDSSTVLAFARRARGEVPALSFVYPQSRECNEDAHIEAALGQDRALWRAIDADAAAPFSRQLDYFVAEPGHALIYAGWINAFRGAAEDLAVTSVLTGIGGDSVLFGDRPPPVHFADLLREWRWLEASRQIRHWSSRHEVPRPFGYWLKSAALQPLARWYAGRQFHEPTPFPDWINSDYAASSDLAVRDRRRNWRRERTVRATHQSDGVRRSVQGLYAFYRQQRGIDFRHPLLARPLIEFMRDLPVTLQLSPQCDRLLHRHAIEGIVDDRIRLRRSKGGPNQAIFSGLRNNPQWQDKLCDDPIVARRGYVDRERWREAVRLFAAGHCRAFRQFQATAILEAWFQQLGDEISADRIDHLASPAGMLSRNQITSPSASR